MEEFRYTITGVDGTVSFVGPAHASKMLAAGCARDPNTVGELLEYTKPFDADFVTSVVYGLVRFDEHNLHDDTAAIEREIEQRTANRLPPFRIYNEATRAASSQPARLGLVIYNLVARRIVQVQNRYAEILRRDRGRIRENGRPVRRLYHYQLDDSWSFVP